MIGKNASSSGWHFILRDLDMSKKYAKLENKGTIEAPWGGTQDYDVNSYFVLEKDKEED